MSKSNHWKRLNQRNARNERAWQQEVGELERRGRREARAYRRNLDEQALQMRLKMLDQPTPRRPHNTQQDGVHPVLALFLISLGVILIVLTIVALL